LFSLIRKIAKNSELNARSTYKVLTRQNLRTQTSERGLIAFAGSKQYRIRNEQLRSKLRGIEGKDVSRTENVGWVEAHSAETHRLERWVSLTLNPSYP
jgi:hypothetical protein